MTDSETRARRDAIRAEYAEEEAEAAAAEGLEKEQGEEQAVLSVRVPAHLLAGLKSRAATEHIPTSALVRRILSRALDYGVEGSVMTVSEVERIARRVVEESRRESEQQRAEQEQPEQEQPEQERAERENSEQQRAA